MITQTSNSNLPTFSGSTIKVIEITALLLFVYPGVILSQASSEWEQPSLSLPNIEGRFKNVNSLRAWHYLPQMVDPLQQIGNSFEASKLSWRMRVMLMTVTSSANGCLYCLCSGVKILTGEGLSNEEISSLQRDIQHSKFSEKEKALLRVAEDITKSLQRSSKTVREAVRAGWSEEEVAHAIFVVSYYNMLNRIAVAFRLPPDSSHPFDPFGPLPMIKCQ